jgi:hypothetical protein
MIHQETSCYISCGRKCSLFFRGMLYVQHEPRGRTKGWMDGVQSSRGFEVAHRCSGSTGAQRLNMIVYVF